MNRELQPSSMLNQSNNQGLGAKEVTNFPKGISGQEPPKEKIVTENGASGKKIRPCPGCP